MAGLGDFILESGVTLRNLQLAYASYGKLNASKDNAILITTWYTGTSKKWDVSYIGKEHALNPEKYFIITVNQISSGLSTSPHNTPYPFGKGYFPSLSISDDVRAQYKLLTEKFGVTKLALVVGGSMGAMQTYEWCVRYPDFVQRAAPIAGTAVTGDLRKTLSQSLIDALRTDPNYKNGFYTDSSEVHDGLRRHSDIFALLGWSAEFYRKKLYQDFGYSNAEDFKQQYFFPLFAFLDPNDLIIKAYKWQRFDVSRAFGGDLKAALGRVKAKVFIMPIDQDMFFTPDDCAEDQKLIKNSELKVIKSAHGHFALLAMEPNYIPQVDKYLNELLSIKV